MISQVGFPDRIKLVTSQTEEIFLSTPWVARGLIPGISSRKPTILLYSPGSTLSAKKRYPHQNSKPPLQGSPSSPKVYIIFDLR